MSGIFGMGTEAIFETVAEVEFFTIATEFLPAVRIVAHELSEMIAASAKLVVARGVAFIGNFGDANLPSPHILSTDGFMAILSQGRDKKRSGEMCAPMPMRVAQEMPESPGSEW